MYNNTCNLILLFLLTSFVAKASDHPNWHDTVDAKSFPGKTNAENIKWINQ
jgi:hypothetical protein